MFVYEVMFMLQFKAYSSDGAGNACSSEKCMTNLKMQFILRVVLVVVQSNQ